MRVLWVMVLVFALGIGTAAAQEAIGISPTLAEQLELIEGYVEQVRGLELQEPLTRVFPTREEVSVFLEESITEQLTPEIVEEARAFYAAFDFIEPDVDIVGTYLDLLNSQVAGYYDPVEKTMNTILISGEIPEDELPFLEQEIYAHEFVHSLQDQNFDLLEIGFDPENLDAFEADQIIAIQSLVEGDATIIMQLYVQSRLDSNPLLAIEMLTSGFASGAFNMPLDMPPILVRELTFPYISGATFVSALVNEGGWEAVDAAFSNLPVSTEQILHPEKYIAGEMPITVELGDTDSALDSSWQLVNEETIGEFYLRAYLDNYIEATAAADAADGWGGDRYRIYQQESTGDYAMIARINWDTADEADEFVHAYARFGFERFGVSRDGDCWVGSGDSICMLEVNGDTVITRAPSADVARALLLTQS